MADDYGRQHYADHISIFLMKEGDRSERKIMCINCGKQIFVVYNKIKHVTNSSGIPIHELGEDVAVVEHKCRWCGTMFLLYR